MGQFCDLVPLCRYRITLTSRRLDLEVCFKRARQRMLGKPLAPESPYVAVQAPTFDEPSKGSFRPTPRRGEAGYNEFLNNHAAPQPPPVRGTRTTGNRKSLGNRKPKLGQNQNVMVVGPDGSGYFSDCGATLDRQLLDANGHVVTPASKELVSEQCLANPFLFVPETPGTSKSSSQGFRVVSPASKKLIQECAVGASARPTEPARGTSEIMKVPAELKVPAEIMKVPAGPTEKKVPAGIMKVLGLHDSTGDPRDHDLLEDRPPGGGNCPGNDDGANPFLFVPETPATSKSSTEQDGADHPALLRGRRGAAAGRDRLYRTAGKHPDPAAVPAPTPEQQMARAILGIHDDEDAPPAACSPDRQNQNLCETPPDGGSHVVGNTMPCWEYDANQLYRCWEYDAAAQLENALNRVVETPNVSPDEIEGLLDQLESESSAKEAGKNSALETFERTWAMVRARKRVARRRKREESWDGNGLAYPHRTGFSYDKQTSVMPDVLHSPCHSVEFVLTEVHDSGQKVV